jgi:DNA polymerase (family 10)
MDAMNITLEQVVNTLNEIVFYLEIKGDNPFKIRAYDHAASHLSNLGEDWIRLLRTGELAKIKGFGDVIILKLNELVDTGKISLLDNLRQEFPPSILELTQIPGVGPKKIKAFYQDLNISTTYYFL